jgi:glycosyltransferase involved in cell wall biosynthesis
MFLAKAFQTDPRPRQEGKSLVEANYSVYVLAWDREGQFKRVENVDGVIVRSFTFGSLRGFSGVALALGAIVFQILLLIETVKIIGRLKQRPVIHAHDFNTLLPGCLLKILGLSAGLVYDCHEVSHAAYSELFSPVIGCIVRAIEQRCLGYAEVVITVSHTVAAYLRKFNPSTEVIYNCPRVDDVPRLSKEQARVRLDIPLNAFVVSSVGTIRYDCRLDLLLAVALLTKKENLQYLVVGDGPLASEFRRAVKKAGATCLTTMPHVSRELALQYVSASDLTWVVYESRGSSLNPRMTIPWKFFESLACGVPVIVEPGTVRAELVKELNCGLVLGNDDPSNISQAIISLAANPDQICRMRAEAKRAFATQFNWEIMSNMLVGLYERL